jgi:chromosome segregation ATPase
MSHQQAPPNIREQQAIDKKLAHEAMQYLGLGERSNQLVKQAASISEQLQKTTHDTGAALGDVVEQIGALRTTIARCGEALKNTRGGGIGGGGGGVGTASLKQQLDASRVQLEQYKKQIEDARSTADAERSRREKETAEQLANFQQRLEAKQRELDEFTAQAKTDAAARNARQEEVRQKIEQLEKERLQSKAAASAVEADRVQLLATLAQIDAKLASINALKQRCAENGKSLAEELGEMGVKVESLDKERSQNKQTVEAQLQAINQSIASIEEKIGNAYEQECAFREQLTQETRDQTQHSEAEFTLQQAVDAEKTKVAALEQQLAQLQREKVDQDAAFQDVQAQLATVRRELEQQAAERRTQQERIAQLEKEADELLRSTADLNAKKANCEATKAALDVKCKNNLQEKDAQLAEHAQALAVADEEKRAIVAQLQRCGTALRTRDESEKESQQMLAVQSEQLTELENLRRENLDLKSKIDELQQANAALRQK